MREIEREREKTPVQKMRDMEKHRQTPEQVRNIQAEIIASHKETSQYFERWNAEERGEHVKEAMSAEMSAKGKLEQEILSSEKASKSRGENEAVQAVSRDVSKKKEGEQSLRRAEQERKKKSSGGGSDGGGGELFGSSEDILGGRSLLKKIDWFGGKSGK